MKSILINKKFLIRFSDEESAGENNEENRQPKLILIGN